MRHIIRIGTTTVFLLLFAATVSASFLAHADYARSQPAADEVLPAAPSQVQVWFTQELFRREGENWLHVTGPDGARVDVGDTLVDDNDRTLLTVTLAEDLAEGGYRVEWRALSADDGHPKEGAFGFSVGMQNLPPTATGAAPATTTAQPTAEPATSVPTTTVPATSAPAGGFPCLGSAPLAMLAVGAVLARRRRS